MPSSNQDSNVRQNSRVVNQYVQSATRSRANQLLRGLYRLDLRHIQLECLESLVSKVAKDVEIPRRRKDTQSYSQTIGIQINVFEYKADTPCHDRCDVLRPSAIYLRVLHAQAERCSVPSIRGKTCE